MFSQEFECPSCGGTIKQKRPGSKSLFCPFCGQTSHLHANSLTAVGKQQLLIDYGSSLSIGQQLQLDERDFQVLGRLRINYRDGFWDEWYVNFLDDGSEAWIQEDDGSFVLFKEAKKVEQNINFEAVTVGAYYDLGKLWEPIFVTEKSRAKINGGEGELPFKIVPGEQADFIDGIWKGKVVSIELLVSERVLFVGQPFQLQELVVE